MKGLALNGRLGMILYGLMVTLGYIIPFSAGFIGKDHGGFSAILVFSSFAYLYLLELIWGMVEKGSLMTAKKYGLRLIARVYIYFTLVGVFLLGAMIEKQGFHFEFDDTLLSLIVGSGWIQALMMWHVSEKEKGPSNG